MKSGSTPQGREPPIRIIARCSKPETSVRFRAGVPRSLQYGVCSLEVEALACEAEEAGAIPVNHPKLSPW